jgi:hypothetical protein
MRVPEENCNMVLLAAVTLFSSMVAITAGVWQGAQSTATEALPADKPPIYLAADRTAVPPVRVVGAPFVPNLNPRDR